MTKTDQQLQQDVEAELRFEPKVNAARIGVTVEDGAVTLTGTTDSYAEKWAAEAAAKRVFGVKAITQELKIQILAEHEQTDANITAAVSNALRWNTAVPSSISAHVHRGTVTLEGQVGWQFERDAAEHAVRHLMGVTDVHNLILLTPATSAVRVKEKIEAALRRQARTDTSSIHVSTSGGKVTLTGHAASLSTIDGASAAAWGAPGVTDVVDQLTVSSI